MSNTFCFVENILTNTYELVPSTQECQYTYRQYSRDSKIVISGTFLPKPSPSSRRHFVPKPSPFIRIGFHFKADVITEWSLFRRRFPEIMLGLEFESFLRFRILSEDEIREKYNKLLIIPSSPVLNDEHALFLSLNVTSAEEFENICWVDIFDIVEKMKQQVNTDNFGLSRQLVSEMVKDQRSTIETEMSTFKLVFGGITISPNQQTSIESLFSSATTDIDVVLNRLTCEICLERPKNVAFACGHMVCEPCSERMEPKSHIEKFQMCHICRVPIYNAIKLANETPGTAQSLSSELSKSDIKKQISCGMCMERVNEIVLPCGHMLCGPCSRLMMPNPNLQPKQCHKGMCYYVEKCHVCAEPVYALTKLFW